MSILELLRSDGSITINKKLAHAIGIDATIMYSELISKHFYFDARQELTDDGFFFNTVENMQADTALSKYQQSKAIKKLVELDLIKHRNKGLPQRRYFKIMLNSESKVSQLLATGEKLKNSTFKSKKTKQTEVEKVDSNNTKVNNTNLINKEKGANREFALSFYSFKSKYSVDEESIEVIEHYLERYHFYQSKSHPNLKAHQWQTVIDELYYGECNKPDGYEEFSGHELKYIIDEHFKTKYDNCDYNILHFISGQIRALRYYELGC